MPVADTGTCQRCRYAVPDARALRCVHPMYQWTFRAGPTYCCERYEPQPKVVLDARPRPSSKAVAMQIHQLLGTHYQLDLSTRRQVQDLSVVWREALALEARANGKG